MPQGNDPEEDSDREPEPPTKVKDKPVARIGKRDALDTAPVKAAGGDSRDSRESRGGGRGRGRGGNEGGMLCIFNFLTLTLMLISLPAFHDRDAGSTANRRNQDFVNQTDRPYRGRGGDRGGRGRGGRGREFRDQRDDRQSHGRPKYALSSSSRNQTDLAVSTRSKLINHGVPKLVVLNGMTRKPATLLHRLMPKKDLTPMLMPLLMLMATSSILVMPKQQNQQNQKLRAKPGMIILPNKLRRKWLLAAILKLASPMKAVRQTRNGLALRH